MLETWSWEMWDNLRKFDKAHLTVSIVGADFMKMFLRYVSSPVALCYLFKSERVFGLVAGGFPTLDPVFSIISRFFPSIRRSVAEGYPGLTICS